MRKSHHVVHDTHGGWSVKRGGADRASKRFETQEQAMNYARRLAKSHGSELYIHGRDGRIREKNSYGRDPVPPKDKR